VSPLGLAELFWLYRISLAPDQQQQRGFMMRRYARLSLLASVCAAMAVIAMSNADAASKFDGTWSAVFRTKSGPCQPAYRGAVQVVDGNMEVAGAGGSLSGRVLSNGSVKATGNMGSNYGAASGRVSGNSGSGTWRARMESGSCTGVWTAQSARRAKGSISAHSASNLSATMSAPVPISTCFKQGRMSRRVSLKLSLAYLPPVF
jgi:hypothetical protein